MGKHACRFVHVAINAAPLWCLGLSQRECSTELWRSDRGKLPARNKGAKAGTNIETPKKKWSTNENVSKNKNYAQIKLRNQHV